MVCTNTRSGALLTAVALILAPLLIGPSLGSLALPAPAAERPGAALSDPSASLFSAGHHSQRPEVDASGQSSHWVFLPSVQNGLPGGEGATTSGRMTADETWRGTLLLTGDVEVPQGVTLTIEPGTTVLFAAHSDDQSDPGDYDPNDHTTLPATMITILVFGTLDARGTSSQPITFTSNRDPPGEEDWQSIMVEGQGRVNLEHVVLENGYFGLQLSSPGAQASFHRSTIRNAAKCGICGHGPPITGPIIISDSRFIDCGREAIDTYANQNFVVRHNVFAANYVGIMSVGSSITVEDNLFIRNIRGIGIVERGDPTITGNEFTETDGAAIFVAEGSPSITNNNMYGNVFNVQLEQPSSGVTAENNWWGSADSSAIAASIWDGNDDPVLGLVDFEPFATEAFDLDVPEFE